MAMHISKGMGKKVESNSERDRIKVFVGQRFIYASSYMCHCMESTSTREKYIVRKRKS